jgi:predicted amidohydrolase
MTPLAVCVAQTCPSPGDVPSNLEQHLRLVEVAAAHEAQLVLFPELSLTGYELELAERAALSEDDARLLPLADAARSHALTLVVGAPVRVEQRLYNGALVFRPDRTRLLYKKQYLGAFGEGARCDGNVPPPEASVFQPGNSDLLVQLGETLAALAICSDIGRAQHARRAREGGATAYLASMFVIPSEFDGDATRLEQYAQEHSMLVAMANFGAATGGLSSAGRSSIWSPDGVLSVQLPPRGAGIGVSTSTPGGWRSQIAMLT